MEPGRASDPEPRACFQGCVERENSSVCCHGFDQRKNGCCASERQWNSAPERGPKSWFSHSGARNGVGGSVGTPLSMRSRDLKSSVGCFRVKSLHGTCDAQRRLAMCFDGPAQPSIHSRPRRPIRAHQFMRPYGSLALFAQSCESVAREASNSRSCVPPLRLGRRNLLSTQLGRRLLPPEE